jgi:hypothetical protein
VNIVGYGIRAKIVTGTRSGRVMLITITRKRTLMAEQEIDEDQHRNRHADQPQ